MSTNGGAQRDATWGWGGAASANPHACSHHGLDASDEVRLAWPMLSSESGHLCKPSRPTHLHVVSRCAPVASVRARPLYETLGTGRCPFRNPGRSFRGFRRSHMRSGSPWSLGERTTHPLSSRSRPFQSARVGPLPRCRLGRSRANGSGPLEESKCGRRRPFGNRPRTPGSRGLQPLGGSMARRMWGAHGGLCSTSVI